MIKVADMINEDVIYSAAVDFSLSIANDAGALEQAEKIYTAIVRNM